MTKPRLHGLYAITDAGLIPAAAFTATVEQAMLGGARVIQYRNKSNNAELRLQQARALNELCQSYRVPLIINDDVALAAIIGAAGVHLGQDDLSIAAARAQLGNGAIIGASCYNRLDLVLAAAHQGADYVALGSFFPSPSKPAAVRAEIDLLRQARQALTITVVAIGGITPDNAKSLVQAGADCVAVISGVFGQSDVQAAARAYADLYP